MQNNEAQNAKTLINAAAGDPKKLTAALGIMFPGSTKNEVISAAIKIYVAAGLDPIAAASQVLEMDVLEYVRDNLYGAFQAARA